MMMRYYGTHEIEAIDRSTPTDHNACILQNDCRNPYDDGRRVVSVTKPGTGRKYVLLY